MLLNKLKRIGAMTELTDAEFLAATESNSKALEYVVDNFCSACGKREPNHANHCPLRSRGEVYGTDYFN